jgi:hypothetical protein
LVMREMSLEDLELYVYALRHVVVHCLDDSQDRREGDGVQDDEALEGAEGNVAAHEDTAKVFCMPAICRDKVRLEIARRHIRKRSSWTAIDAQLVRPRLGCDTCLSQNKGNQNAMRTHPHKLEGREMAVTCGGFCQCPRRSAASTLIRRTATASASPTPPLRFFDCESFHPYFTFCLSTLTPSLSYLQSTLLLLLDLIPYHPILCRCKELQVDKYLHKYQCQTFSIRLSFLCLSRAFSRDRLTSTLLTLPYPFCPPTCSGEDLSRERDFCPQPVLRECYRIDQSCVQ